MLRACGTIRSCCDTKIILLLTARHSQLTMRVPRPLLHMCSIDTECLPLGLCIIIRNRGCGVHRFALHIHVDYGDSALEEGGRRTTTLSTACVNLIAQAQRRYQVTSQTGGKIAISLALYCLIEVTCCFWSAVFPTSIVVRAQFQVPSLIN